MLVVNPPYYYAEVDNNGGGAGDETSYHHGVGEFQKVSSIEADGRDRYGMTAISAVTFDIQEELLWRGNRGGHVASYYGTNLQPYTSFQVIQNQEIRQILTFDEIILVLSERQLRGQLRRGIPVFNHTSENLFNMQCMLQTSVSTVLLGGHQETLVEFDLQQNMETQAIPLEGAPGTGCAILRGQGTRDRICAGLTSGQVYMLDVRSYRMEQKIEAHSGSLSDLDVHGNFLVTCGFSDRHGVCSVDRFLKIYDLRMLRALAPIQVSIDPIMLKFIPNFSSRIAAISPTGQMEILETQAVSSANIMIYQVTNGPESRAFDVSPGCHHLAFGDETGALSVFGSHGTTMFNPFSRETEFAVENVITFPPMGFDENACLASIPLPAMLANEQLSSDWPSHLIQPGYRPHPEVSPQILQSMKMVGPIGYAPNPGNLRRNQMQYKFDINRNGGNPISNKQPLSPAMVSPTGRHIGHKQFSPTHQSPQSPVNRSHSRPGHLPHHLPRQSTPNNTLNQGKFHIPKRYSRIDWKKSSMEPADMEPFNKTNFCGLESVTVNAYCNPMIQVLYHIEYLRGFLISHLCKREACLSCELGFLFHMMDQSASLPCSGSNFLRSFRVVPEATALGLIRQENQAKHRAALYRLISNWNRFILHQIETETGDKNEHESTSKHNGIEELFGMKQENMNKCTRCREVSVKESTVFLFNLLHESVPKEKDSTFDFVELLEKALRPEQSTSAWCEKCQRYSQTVQKRTPKNLPHVLSVNTCLDGGNKDFEGWTSYMESLLKVTMSNDRSALSISAPATPSPSSLSLSAGPGNMKSCRYGISCARMDCKFWHEGRSVISKAPDFQTNAEVQMKWLPLKLRVIIGEDGDVKVLDLDNDNPPNNTNGGNVADYELTSVVVYIKDPELEDKNNLVALVKVGNFFFERAKQPPSPKGGWFLFNDFCVKEVGSNEATHFSPKWKLPSVVYYQKVNTEEFTSYPVTSTVTADVFQDLFLPKPKAKDTPGKNKPIKQPIPTPYKPLDPEEIPKKGELVAIDAEFVTLGQEETELRDGKLATVKPQQLSLARVTCLRGQGKLEGTPFLDDYISTQEVVVDYLTKFSGIQPGDLDVNYSSKHLITLKSVYLKLRFLIDSGVKFVGHGLNNDFRVINLIVPPEQVIDTVNLFYLPNQRMVSLRFLAWHFLGEVIQSDTHDSAEDARAALKLYRKYEELKELGRFDKALEELYEVGVRLNWRVNGSDKL